MAKRTKPLPLWLPLLIGGVLILIPDPAPFVGPSAAAGLLLITGTFGYRLTR